MKNLIRWLTNRPPEYSVIDDMVKERHELEARKVEAAEIASRISCLDPRHPTVLNPFRHAIRDREVRHG